MAACQAAGYRTVPVPGASSALAALGVAGDTVARGFVFIGFLPPKGNDRVAALNVLAARDDAQVLFEAPHRIDTLLKGLAGVAPHRTITICRELTKQFEGVSTMPAADAPAWLAADPNRSRGEFVLVVHAQGREAAEGTDGAHDKVLRTLMAELSLKQAVGLAAELTGAPRNLLYARALALKQATAD